MKGKYAARAANRDAAAEQESTEAAYRRRVLKLTEERDAARSGRDTAKKEWAKEVRILRAQLAEGTSPRVEALTRGLNRMRGERDELARWKKESAQKYGVIFTRIADHFMTEHGLTPVESADVVVRLYEGVDSETIIVDKGVEARFADRYGTEAALAIRKARGNWRPTAGSAQLVVEPTS